MSIDCMFQVCRLTLLSVAQAAVAETPANVQENVAVGNQAHQDVEAGEAGVRDGQGAEQVVEEDIANMPLN